MILIDLYDGIQYDSSIWGMNLEDGAVTNLMTPSGMKDYVKNSSRLQHGKRYVIPEEGTNNGSPKYEERSIDLPVHIISKNPTDYFQKYGDFCTKILEKGKFGLWTEYIPDKTFRLVYNSCSNFNQIWREMAVFTLRCTEPDPTDTELIPIE